MWQKAQILWQNDLNYVFNQLVMNWKYLIMRINGYSDLWVLEINNQGRHILLILSSHGRQFMTVIFKVVYEWFSIVFLFQIFSK